MGEGNSRAEKQRKGKDKAQEEPTILLAAILGQGTILSTNWGVVVPFIASERVRGGQFELGVFLFSKCVLLVQGLDVYLGESVIVGVLGSRARTEQMSILSSQLTFVAENDRNVISGKVILGFDAHKKGTATTSDYALAGKVLAL